jgi:DNA-binding MarR family transcriptional regulator
MAGTVARELKQQKPFFSPEEEIFLGLRIAAARVVEPWAKFLKTTAQLTNNQYNVLRILRGSHPAKLACSDISERMIDRDPDVTRLVDRLERRGLVTRMRNRRDRRVVEVGISDKGLALVRGLDAHVQRLPKVLLGHLGVERLRQLGRLLEAVISDLGTFP